MQSVPVVEEVRLGRKTGLGGQFPTLFLAGPCVIEGRDPCLALAENLAQIADKLGISIVFKASFDKANRTSVDAFRGPGLEEGLRILQDAGEASGLLLTTDVHETGQMDAVAEVVDLIQIPALLCRQTDLLLAAAATGKPVNVKKGQFLSPEDMTNVATKVSSLGAPCIVTERGFSFGYQNLVTDFRGVAKMRAAGLPIIFDATHSLQQPGGLGRSTAGTPEFCAPLARAAAACGVDGFFFEVHHKPAEALCDSTTQITPDAFASLVPVLLDLGTRVREDSP